MAQSYYEVVFEGHYKAIRGILEGYRLGCGKPDWIFHFSRDAEIEAETMTEVILEYITLKTKLHHVIMAAEFFEPFEKSLDGIEDSSFLGKKYIRSAQRIKDASFQFETRTYGLKYGTEIQALLKNLPQNLELHDYNPIEKSVEEGKGIELYAPEHEYSFEATGRISGDIMGILDFRKKLDDHPLVNVKKIILSL